MKQIHNSLLKLLILASLLVLFIGVIPSVYAADIVASGYCGGEGDGTNLTWTLDSEGVLTISGTGKMKDYTSKNAPWQENGTDIKSIVFSSGTTYIGNYAFYCCTAESVAISFPDTLESIGKYAFYKTALSGELVFPQQLKSIGTSASGAADPAGIRRADLSGRSGAGADAGEPVDAHGYRLSAFVCIRGGDLTVCAEALSASDGEKVVSEAILRPGGRP